LLDRFVDLLHSSLLLAFFLPVLVWYFIRSRSSSRRADSNRTERSKVDLLKRRIAGQFSFERAIEAYEELIDETFAEGLR
jgi:hypothetical protein